MMCMLMIEIIIFRSVFFSGNGVLTYFGLLLFVYILVYIVFLIQRVLFSKPNIALEADHVISMKHRRYDASQIECIYINYRRIGFKMYGKRLVPMDLCFYFKRDQETAGVEAVHEWAARNDKEIKHKFFQTLA